MRERHVAQWVRVAEWEQYSWLCHGFSTRSGEFSTIYAGGGEPERNLGYTQGDGREQVQRNREAATREVGGEAARLTTMRQVHGTRVLAVEEPGLAGDADGLVTREPGLVLGVLAADCVPILLVDVKRRMVGALHAGWRGTAAGMVSAGVQRMLELGACREDMMAAIGPSIGACCYEVGEEVKRALSVRPEKSEGIVRESSVDLWESNRRQLLREGVNKISVAGECTACTRLPDGRRKYFSHRAERGVTGRMMGMIGIAALEEHGRDKVNLVL